MSANGQLPLAELAPIPAGYLRRDAAAAFNAMDRASLLRYNVPLRPLGPLSSYRNYQQQQELWELYQSAGGAPVAAPGTSTHGWGLAVDLATPQMRGIVDRIGGRFGWSKSWSDAPDEWWHVLFKPGIWPRSLVELSAGADGDAVAVLQQALRAQGGGDLVVDGLFGPATSAAVRAFQAAEHLAVDGVAGRTTIDALGLSDEQLRS